MNNFDHHNYAGNFIRPEKPLNSPIPEHPDQDAPVRRSIMSIPVVRIIAIILLVAFVLYFLYTVCLHPMHKLNLRLALARHCVIKISVRSYWNGGSTTYYTLIIYMDENAFAIGKGYPEPSKLDYYKVEGDVIYIYSEVSKEWYETNLDDDEDTIFSAGMFDRKNYEWAKGKLFVWKYKDRDIYFKHRFGNFKFTFGYGYGEIVLEFKRIGFRHLDVPREK